MIIVFIAHDANAIIILVIWLMIKLLIVFC